MFLKRHPLVLTAACAVVALLLAIDPASAARGGGGGGRGGGGRGGSYGGGRGYGGGGYGGYRGGYGGYRGGYGGYGYGYGGYGFGGLGLYLGGYSPGYYSGYYPSYNTDYYTPSIYSPSVDYTTSSNYYTPAAPDTTVVAADRAHVEVRVPTADAQVLFDGSATQQQGVDRMFVTPSLTPGRTFSYTVEARWMENGRTMNKTQTVTVTAGQTAAVDFGR